MRAVCPLHWLTNLSEMWLVPGRDGLVTAAHTGTLPVLAIMVLALGLTLEAVEEQPSRKLGEPAALSNSQALRSNLHISVHQALKVGPRPVPPFLLPASAKATLSQRRTQRPHSSNASTLVEATYNSGPTSHCLVLPLRAYRSRTRDNTRRRDVTR